MTVRQIADTVGTVNSMAVVEISPQKILYEVLMSRSNPDADRYRLALPWTYILFSGKGPLHILGAHFPITGVDEPLGALPFLGSDKTRTCFAYVPGAYALAQNYSDFLNQTDLLTQTISVMNSGGLSSYIHYGSDVPSRVWFGGTTCDELYSAWEAYEDFPPECPLDHITLREFGIEALLEDPKVLAE